MNPKLKNYNSNYNQGVTINREILTSQENSFVMKSGIFKSTGKREFAEDLKERS